MRRMLHDMTFAASREKGQRGPVTETTGWSNIPECELSEVMNDIVKRILGLRTKFGTGRRILINEKDVKRAFRQIGVYPASKCGGFRVRVYVKGCGRKSLSSSHEELNILPQK